LIPSNWHLLSETPELQAQVQNFLRAWQQDLPFIFQSSGSTGKPKSFQFTKDQLLTSAKASTKALQLDKHTKALVCLPLTSVGGLLQLARAIHANFELFIDLPTSRPLQNFDTAINFISMVPTQLQQSLKHEPLKLSGIEKILIGGAPLEENLIEACSNLSISLIQSYGMTETLSHVALRFIGNGVSAPFKAIEGVHFEQQQNCLTIHYPALLDAPLYTNDLVNLIDEQHFEWLGRADFAINSGGVKIIPEQLEKTLSSVLSHPFFVTSVPDDKWGSVVGLVIEGEAVDLGLDWAALGLVAAAVPKKIAFIAQFQRTQTLKIKRQETLANLTDASWRSL
jgi:O-succinylbenzoic acid--CoA ligase